MATHRSAVIPIDPEFPSTCLCGYPADFVIETSWFSGRRSRDPVCDQHVSAVVDGIAKKNARRDGAS
jgi:hypothetical protein